MKIFLLIIFSCFFLNTFSQGVNNLWLMGYQSWASQPFGGVNIDFATGIPAVNYVDRQFNLNSTNGVICDANGNLLFCSNGVYIANSNFDTLLNGGGLNPAPYTSMRDSGGLAIDQANLIIPKPGDSKKYY
jgi:hypothetical protein